MTRVACRLRGLAAGFAVLIAGCASVPVPAEPPREAQGPGWVAAPAAVRAVGLGLPGGVRLGPGVRFVGGIELVLDPASPLHSLSDLKLVGARGDFVAVSDAGDLVWGRLVLDVDGRLAGAEGLATRRLTLTDGSPIVDKADGDAEGLAITPDGDLLISFERRHRIWDYGPALSPAARPVPVAAPTIDFPPNDGMEALAAHGEGWRVAGESGGVWDCVAAGCEAVVAPPPTPLRDSDYRITGLDKDPDGDGFFAIQRRFSPPVDVRARLRRMARDGALGPVLVELTLPSTTDNFEGVAAVRRGDATRVYILSDDNGSAVQRTLLLAFDLRD